MKHTMIVVADSYCARIFNVDAVRSTLTEVETLINPQGRLHDRDITSDLPGKMKGVDGSGGHTYQTRTDPKKHAMAEFARVVAGCVNKVSKDNNLANLLLVAEPSFLGELRVHLADDTAEKIVFELNKNLTQKNPDEITQYLPRGLLH
ncbi:MAG: protein required for attachment to host cells [Paraglaciecola sp.]|jgi:protein required for attachment to host cells